MAMDLYKGWPFDGALNDNAKPKASEGIVAGMFIKKDANGELIKATGAAGEQVYFALEDQDAFPVEAADKMAYIVGNAIVLTDQYTATGIIQGSELEVDSGNPGKIKLQASGDIIGWADGTVVRDELTLLKVKLNS
jgi:hypothetical protein